jgi:hypothetical protein
MGPDHIAITLRVQSAITTASIRGTITKLGNGERES